MAATKTFASTKFKISNVKGVVCTIHQVKSTAAVIGIFLKKLCPIYCDADIVIGIFSKNNMNMSIAVVRKYAA